MAYVVNKHGAVHSVPDEWLQSLIAAGMRPARDDEVAAWYQMQGLELPEVNNGADEHGGADQPGERPHRRPRRG